MIRRMFLAATVALALGAGVVSVQAADIVDTAIKNGSFKTLVTALKAADLVGVLKGKGPLTVFAPTDAAFAKVPKSLLAELLKPENKDRLVKVLTYHVVPGKVMSADIAGKWTTAKTVEGASVWINAAWGSVWVNQAKVVTADIETSNGVIHVIDNVLIPLY